MRIQEKSKMATILVVQAYLIEKPSLELCRHLVMLRDYNISGRINLMEIPVLLHMLHFWKVLLPCFTCFMLHAPQMLHIWKELLTYCICFMLHAPHASTGR